MRLRKNELCRVFLKSYIFISLKEFLRDIHGIYF